MEKQTRADLDDSEYVAPPEPPQPLQAIEALPVPAAVNEPLNVPAHISHAKDSLRLRFYYVLGHSRKILAAAAVLLLISLAGAFHTQVIKALSGTYAKIIQSSAAVSLPRISSNEIRVKGSVQLASALSRIDNQKIELSFASNIVKPTPATVRSWVSQSREAGGYVVLTPNEQAINSWLSSEISSLTKQPVAEVSVTHSDGTSAVLQQGADGLNFPSDSQLAGTIDARLTHGGGINSNLPGIVVPYTTTDQPTVGKLIEVDVTTKKLYAYQNGSLINTFLVTAGAPATPTPLGTFHIWDKLLSQNMYAYYPDGKLEYYQPDVQWVNYFDHSGDAIHGNYWRPLSYFGNVNSSHGCVGLINSQAEWIYDWAPIGTTVVIHA